MPNSNRYFGFLDETRKTILYEDFPEKLFINLIKSLIHFPQA